NALAHLTEVGSPLAAALVAILAALSALFVVRLAREVDPVAPPEIIMGVSGVVMCMLLMRIRMRPETAGLVIMPASMWLTYRYRGATGRRRLHLGLGIAGLGVLWAQCHGSFVLAPVLLFAILSFDVRRDDW